jgi:phage terminase large subunit GpA-like protein
MTLAAQFAADLVLEDRPDIVDWAGSLTLPFRVSQSRPGPYSPDGFPYVPEILRAIADPEVRKVTACIGTQGAKTLTGTIGVLYLLDQDPGNTLIGLSKTDLARSFSRERFQPLVDENDFLAAHKRPDPDEYKTLEMAFDRATYFLASTQSPSDLISRPCRNVWIDEAQLAGQGSIAEAFQRTKRYPLTYKHLLTGTPTGPECDLWQHCQRGTCEILKFPCPFCKVEITFENSPADQRVTAPTSGEAAAETSNEKPETTHRVGLSWSPEAKVEGRWREDLIRTSAHYVCPSCHGRITEDLRRTCLETSRFVVTNPAASAANRSFIVPSLFTPDVSFGEMAWQFISATTDLFQVSHFINGYWAQPYTPPATEVSDAHVDALRDTGYSLAKIRETGRLPFIPRLITLCGDPGERQTHWSIAAHLLNGEFCIIDYGTCLAPEDLLKTSRDYRIHDLNGKEHRIGAGLVDSGDFTDRIYRLCGASAGILFPSKGSGANFGNHFNASTLKSQHGLTLYTYLDYIAKRSLYLDTIQSRRPPAIRFPHDAGPEFINGHCGQKLVITRGPTGLMRKVFAPVANDHFGDCTKLHRVITWIFQMIEAGDAPAGAGSAPPSPN